MPFNSTDFTKAPWSNGVMTLTHEECVHILKECKKIEEAYIPADNRYDPISDFYIQSQYNMIDWTKGINGDTYAVLKQYDVEVNKLGINEQGVVQEEVIEEVIEEEVVDEEVVVEPTEEIIEEPQEEIIEDTPAE